MLKKKYYFGKVKTRSSYLFSLSITCAKNPRDGDGIRRPVGFAVWISVCCEGGIAVFADPLSLRVDLDP